MTNPAHDPQSGPQAPAASAPPGCYFPFSYAQDREKRPAHPPLGTTFDAFCSGLALPSAPSSKDAAPVWSPATFDQDGVRRLDVNVRAVHAYVIDIDHRDWTVLGDIVTRCEAMGLEYYAHSTWSHGYTREVKATKRSPVVIPARPDVNEVCFRIVLPLAVPVSGKDWNDAWWRASTFFGLTDLADRLADPSRIYYRPLPTAITRRAANATRYWFDVTNLPGLPRGQGHEVRRLAMRHKVDPEVLLDFAQKAANSDNMRKKEVGKALTKILNGLPYADKGDAHNTNRLISSHLARAFPDVDPDDLAEYWALSEGVMWPGVVHDIAQLLRRDLERVQAEIEEKSHLTLAANGPGVRPEYTPEELMSLGNVDKLWIVQRDGSYYARTLEGYKGPYSSKEALSALAIDLSPARLPLLNPPMNPAGRAVRKTLVELVDEFGTVGLNTIVDLTATRSVYEPATRTMIEAPCPIRYPELTPEWNPEVDQWLKLLTRTDEHYENLVKWLSHVTNLEKTLAAIVFTGAPHVGKGAFARGVADIWSRSGPSDIGDVLGNWNDTIVSHGPVVFADEELPVDFRGRVEFGKLRKLIGDHDMKLRRRWCPTAVVKGCMRLIVAANNDDIFVTRGSLRNDDVEALQSRFYCINVGEAHTPEADRTKTFIEAHAKQWFRTHAITRHVLQLNIARKEAELPLRFGISSTDRSVFNALAVKSGLRGKVCQVLLAWLEAPMFIGKTPKIIAKEGKLLVMTSGIRETWNRATGELPPPDHDIATAVSDLVARKERLDVNGQKYREINLELVARYGEHTDGGGAEWIRRRLQECEAAALQREIPGYKPTAAN